MAPVTRSRNPKPAPEKASAAGSSKAAGGKPHPAKGKGKQPAAAITPAEASPSKVQKKNSFNKKKGKVKKASSRTSSSSRKPSSNAASPKRSSEPAPKAPSAQESIKQLVAPTSEPVEEEEEEDDDEDFPELTQAYGILPYLDNPQASPLPLPGTPAPWHPAGHALGPDGNHLMSQFAQHMANTAQGNPTPGAESDLMSQFAQHMANIPQMNPLPPMPPPAQFYPAGHVLRPDEDALMSQFAHHMVNLPPWARMPGMPPMQPMEIPRGFEAARSPPLFPATRSASAERRRSSARSSGAGKFTAAAESEHGNNASQDPGRNGPAPASGGKSQTTSGKAAVKRRLDAAVKRRASSVARDIAQHVREQPASPPGVRKSTRRTSGVVRNIVAQVEEQEPETPVSINNAQAFKRPTVANVRREREQLHDELGAWVQRLRRVRDDFDGVIVEIEERMQILKAVNRMQAPLRRAALGRGR